MGCSENQPYVQRQLAAGTAYSPNASGVITSWSAHASATAGRTLKLLVLRPSAGTQFVVAQKDEVRALSQLSQVNTFTGMHLPIAVGDRLGLFVPPGQPLADGDCGFLTGMAADLTVYPPGFGEPPVGASVDFSSSDATVRLNASAVVEPDADGDGFGDETQDACPGNAATQQPCDTTAPDTTITKGPKDKTKKKQARSSSAPAKPGRRSSAVSTARASHHAYRLRTLKVGKGKHTFQVRAKDAAGNVDPSPAVDDWKVKKKKR